MVFEELLAVRSSFSCIWGFGEIGLWIEERGYEGEIRVMRVEIMGYEKVPSAGVW